MPRIELEAEIPLELADSRFDQAVAAMFPEHSRSRLKAWILDGTLTLDGMQAKPRDKVDGGEQVRLDTPMPEELRVAAQDIEFEVVHEDSTLIVVNKPAGLVVHPGAGNQDRTLQNGLLHRYPELSAVPRAGIVHRLDKDTSGLMLIARTLEAHTFLTRELAERLIKREYLAICHGTMTAGGKVDMPIDRHPNARTKMAVHPRGRPALTHYIVEDRYLAHTLIRARLETGRTHQIRVHMAHIRHGLVGDPVYGGRLRLPAGADEALANLLRGFKRQALHATSLALSHPETG
ncbi:MAG: 23S rRNA pseudouridine(1911/1915/1917) synthase RluD, partial [Pseudomonadota bacterium]